MQSSLQTNVETWRQLEFQSKLSIIVRITNTTAKIIVLYLLGPVLAYSLPQYPRARTMSYYDNLER